MITLRPDDPAHPAYLDEVVGRNCTVHLERMDDHYFCLIIEDAEQRVMLNIGTAHTYRRYVTAHVYANEPAEVK